MNVTSPIASAGNGCAWGDYDLDGDLDLAVGAWSQTAMGNRLFRNNGNGTFADVTGAAIQIPTLTWGFQPNFADLDGDRYPELLFAADFSTTRIFHNNRNGTFTQLPGSSGMVGNIFGMGQATGDFDRDGDLDWYVTSIFAESGPPRRTSTAMRITKQRHPSRGPWRLSSGPPNWESTTAVGDGAWWPVISIRTAGST